MKESKQTTFFHALLLLLLIVLELVCLVRSGIALQIALFIVYPTAWLFCKLFRLDYAKAENEAFNSVRKGMQTLMIMISVGALIGTWIASGTIPALIYYGLKLINPKFFLLCCLLITSVMSVACGTAYGSAASAGIAMMGIGIAMGIPAGKVAGAILCGAIFGDKISPLSDTTNLCPALTGGTLFKHIKTMLWTTVPSYIITAIIFTVLGLKYGAAGADTSSVYEISALLSSTFHISAIALIPVLIVIILLLFRIDALPAIEIGAIGGVIVAWLYQETPLTDVIKMLYTGFTINSGNAVVDKLLNRGGISSMASTVFVMWFALGIGGMLQGLGVLDIIVKPLTKKIKTLPQLVIVTMLVSYLSNMISCAVATSHVITGNVMAPIYKKMNIAPEVCSRTMEDCGTCGGILIPWHGNTVYYTGILGVTFAEYFPYLFLGFLTPIFALLCAFTGIGIYYSHEKSTALTEENINCDKN